MSIYKDDFELLKDEIMKDDIDKKQCCKLLTSIMFDNNEMESEISDLEDELYEVKREIRDLESQVDLLEKGNSTSKPSTLDIYFKNKIFSELSEKYTWYQLEDLLKKNNII